MRRLSVVLVLAALAAAATIEAQVVAAWHAEYTGVSIYDQADAVATDAQGNVYVAGSDWTPIAPASSFVTVKYDPSGRQLWVARYDGPGGLDDVTDMAVDAQGNVVVTGWTQDPTYSWETNYATVKYDTNGNQLWARIYDDPRPGDDEAVAVCVDPQGNVYVTGTSAGSTWRKGYATVKYSPEGNVLWVRRYEVYGHSSYAACIAVDSHGNVYVTGWIYGEYPERADIVTVKYDTNGNQLWVSRFNRGYAMEDMPVDLAVDAQGSVFITGYSYPFALGGSLSDYITLKYDTNGNQQWVQYYNGPGNGEDRAVGVALDAVGNAFVTGKSKGTDTGFDIATIRYDAAGNEAWARRYNRQFIYDDVATDIATDSQGSVYVSGYDQMYRDFLAVKYDSTGGDAWVATYNHGGAGNTWETANAMTLDRFSNVVLTGYVSLSGTGRDFLTVKFTQNRPPVVSVPDSVQKECAGGFADVTLNVFASDPDGDTMAVRLKVGTQVVDTETIQASGAAELLYRYPMGTTPAVVEVTDGSNAATASVSVTVTDTTAAVLSVMGPLDITLEAGTGYQDQGATAVDSCHGDLTGLISIAGLESVSPDVPGDYYIEYSVTDPCSNLTTEVTRTVHVVDTTPPLISPNTVNGEVDLTIEVGTPYVEPGATVVDFVDGPIANVGIGGQTVDWGHTGIYQVEYYAQDSRGNQAVAYRTVTVIDTTPPVIDSYPAEVQVLVDSNVSGAVPDVRGMIVAHDGSGTNVTIEQDLAPGTPITGLGDNHVITVTVRDSSGNEVTCQVRVRLIVCIEGFLPPMTTVVPEGQTPPLPPKAFNAGRVIPLKLKLCGGGTSLGPNQVAPPQIVGLVRDGSAIPLDILDLDAGASSDGGSIFRTSEGQWAFNLSTQGWSAGTYVITILIPDGRRMVGGFVLR